MWQILGLDRIVSLAAFAVVLLASLPATAQPYRYEAEDGTLMNVFTSTSVPGYSGTGYVTGFDNRDEPDDYFELNVDVPEGLYEMWVGYRSPHGGKGYDYDIDGELGSGFFDQTTTFSEDFAGFFSLASGTNTLGIHEGWGFYDVDYLEFRPYSPASLTPITPSLNDARADHPTRVLMNYLGSQYGSKTLSGQHHEQSQNLTFPVSSYLNKSGGIVPAIRSSDFISYSPTRIQFGANPNNESEQTIAWAQETGGIVSMMWHWNAPGDLVNQPGAEWWRGFYDYGTTFDLPGALADPTGADYQLILRDIDAIAAELQKFEDAGVPVIWHPLHEAQGGWFWWGDHGPDAFKELWNLMHDRMTDVHGLHNLIWEYTIASSATEGFSLDWYPGDDKVDLVGLDIYTDPGASMSGDWTQVLDLFNGNKMIALSETGTLPVPNLMNQWGIEWSYFSPWKGSFVDNMTASELQALLNHEDIIVLDELPVFPWNSSENFLSADFDFSGTVDAADLAKWEAAFGVDATGDADGNGTSDGLDFLLWQQQYNASNSSPLAAVVPEPTTLFYLTYLACGCCISRTKRRSTA